MFLLFEAHILGCSGHLGRALSARTPFLSKIIAVEYDDRTTGNIF